MSSAELVQEVEAKLHGAFMIESEVSAKYLVMQAIMGESENLVGEGIGEGGDLNACLSGSIEDYVPSFQPYIDKKDEAFRKNREDLER